MEVNDQQISYFLSLPDQVLEQVVFPTLPVNIITSLCRVHSRFQSNSLWQELTYRDFGIDKWFDVYKTYHMAVNNKQQVINIIESQLLQKRQTGVINPQYQPLLDLFEPAITLISYIPTQIPFVSRITIYNPDTKTFTPITTGINELDYMSSPVDLIFHRIALYDPLTRSFGPVGSFFDVRVLRSEESAWRVAGQLPGIAPQFRRNIILAEVIFYQLFYNKEPYIYRPLDGSQSYLIQNVAEGNFLSIIMLAILDLMLQNFLMNRP